MPKYYFALFLVLIIGCRTSESGEDYAVIYGKVTDPDTPRMQLSDISGAISKSYAPDADGSFRDTLYLDAPRFLRWTDGINSIDLYLENGYRLKMDYDPQDMENTLRFEGTGAPINTYFSHRTKAYQKAQGMDFDAFYALPPSRFLARTKQINKAVKEELAATPGIPGPLREKEIKNIDYSTMVMEGQYKDFFMSQGGESKEAQQEFLDFRDTLSTLDYDQFLYSIWYGALLRDQQRKQVKGLMEKDSLDHTDAYFQVMGALPKGAVRDALLYSEAQGALPYVADREAYYRQFISLCANPMFRDHITANYNTLKKLVPGSPSPLFSEYENHAGGTSSLSDFRGKYVYIDVWATWCGPCRQEFPALKALTKAYMDKKIAFISISIDRRRYYKDWQKMVDEEGLEGTQLLADKAWDSQFVSDYQIKGIPHAILLDSEGRIIQDNAPLPSDPALDTLLKGLEL